MEGIIATLRNSGTTAQSLGVSLGGLAGVFATLATFFVIIWVAVKVSGGRDSRAR